MSASSPTLDEIRAVIREELARTKRRKEFLSFRETARVFGVRLSTVSDWVKHGQLRTVMVNGKRLIPDTEIDRAKLEGISEQRPNPRRGGGRPRKQELTLDEQIAYLKKYKVGSRRKAS